jgi:hypothetical protein
MKHPTSTALHHYWLRCQRGDGNSAVQLHAAALAQLLPCLFLIELTAGGGALFRYCGASLTNRYGRDLQDDSFLALWNATDREILERNLIVMARQSTGLVAGILGETVGDGVSAYEMLILPLATTTRTGGAIGSIARIGGHDERNRIRARLVSQRLQSIRFLGREDAPSGEVALERAKPDRRHAHLTLVAGGNGRAEPTGAAPVTEL